MKLMKILRVVIVLLILGLLGLYFAKDGLVRSAVESAGSEALGVETTLAKCAVALFGGKVDGAQLEVKNPEGFSNDSMIKVGGLHIGAGWNSLMGNPAAVDQITIKNLDVLIEQKGTSTNVQKILENIKKGKSEPSEPKKDGKKLIIRRIELENLKIRGRFDLLGAASPEIAFTIPKITLNNLGGEDGSGMLAAEVGAVIYKTIMDAVASNGAGIFPADFLGTLGSQLSGINFGDLGVEQVGAIVKNIGGLGKEAEGVIKDVEKIGKGAIKDVENIGKEAEKIGKGVQDLLGGKKK